MDSFITRIKASIERELCSIGLQEESIVERAPEIISLLVDSFKEIKQFISTYTFKDEEEEIQFFKEIKPQIYSKLIYYNEIYKIAIRRPNGSNYAQKNYIVKQLDKLQEFFEKNIDFYLYYRTGCTHLDKYYFKRGKYDIQLNLDSFSFELDENFSSSYDFKVAKILANELLRIHLNTELAKLENKSSKEPEHQENSKKYIWTGSKAALVEIIYGFYVTCCLNYGKSGIKELTAFFEEMFNIRLGDTYRVFLEIRGRKGGRTQFLDDMRKKLLERMDDADSRN